MSQLRVRELNSVFGAEIEGLEPPAELDDETCSFLRGAFDDRGLLLFRDLDIDQSYQTYLAHVLIGQASHADDDAVVSGATRDPLYVSNKEARSSAPYGRLLFHSDMMWSEQPGPLAVRGRSRAAGPAHRLREYRERVGHAAGRSPCPRRGPPRGARSRHQLPQA